MTNPKVIEKANRTKVEIYNALDKNMLETKELLEELLRKTRSNYLKESYNKTLNEVNYIKNFIAFVYRGYFAKDFLRLLFATTNSKLNHKKFHSALIKFIQEAKVKYRKKQ